jgi:integrase
MEKAKANKVPLTELRVEELKVIGKTYYVNDAKVPALSIRVSAGGVKAYVFTKFKHKRLIRITLGRVGALRLDAARIAAQKLHGDLALGVDIAAERKAAAGRGETMEEAFQRFMGLKTRRPSTVISYQALWRLYVPVGLKNKTVNDVSVADLQAIVRNLGLRHRSANKVITLIGGIMVKSGRWANNQTREITKHPERVRTRRLSIAELSAVWKATERDNDMGDFFRLLILTGARRSAFCAMRWKDIHLDNGVWMVPVTWSKSKREMAIPLAEEAVRILKARKLNCEQLTGAGAGTSAEWVFPSPKSKTGRAANPDKAWRRLLKTAGIKEHASLHDIRRTLGSRLAMGGVAGATISKVLGHVSPQSLKHYVHLDVTAGREAVDQALAFVIGKPKQEIIVVGCC